MARKNVVPAPGGGWMVKNAKHSGSFAQHQFSPLQEKRMLDQVNHDKDGEIHIPKNNDSLQKTSRGKSSK